MARKRPPRTLWANAYQVAGHLLLSNDLTKGQRQRLRELLLDVLSDPDRFTPKTLATLYRMAVEP